MSTTHKLQGLAVVLFILVMATAFVIPNVGNERGDKAWSARLSRQAAYEQEQAQAQRARDAYAARLTGLAQLEGKAPDYGAAGMSARAMQAWTDRLTGLAEYLASK